VGAAINTISQDVTRMGYISGDSDVSLFFSSTLLIFISYIEYTLYLGARRFEFNDIPLN